jgi:hypothetical protein
MQAVETFPTDPQTMFDIVCKHLHDQGKPAMNEYGDCKYRTEDGCCIPDVLYEGAMEENSAMQLLSQWGNVLGVPVYCGDLEGLASDLQHLHDETHPDLWSRKLSDIAHVHKLDGSIVSELWS